MSDQISLYVNGYFSLGFYTPEGDSVGAQEVAGIILPLLQDGSYMISMGAGVVHRMKDFKIMYHFEVHPEEVDYDFELNE